MHPSRRSAVTAAGVLAALLLPPISMLPTASAAPPSPGSSPGSSTGSAPGIREIAPNKVFPLAKELQEAKAAKSRQRSAPRAKSVRETPAVGTRREWVALDDERGGLYRKVYTLRAVGTKIEVWVASDTDAVSIGTAFREGDCRNNVAGSTEITDDQAKALASEFDTTMFPKEAAAFSTAPDRDGANAQLTGDYGGSGDKIVTLVDNIRDDNFYDFPARQTYTAGFFSSQINDLLDRNVMTIDAFDWKHRTGATPPDEPTSEPCTSRPARARLYEGVFAHEYQHLLQRYQDAIETNLINEGLSDMAVSLSGYADTLASVNEPGTQSHLHCFNGYGTVKTPYNPNPRNCGGPQNSLTIWGDEGSADEILADYGNAWSFLLFLYDRYGLDFVSALHRDGDHQGLNGVQVQLDTYAKGTKVADVIHDYQVMNLVDGVVGPRGRVVGTDRARVTTKSLKARLNLDNPSSYAIPGAAPNGADYVRLRDAAGTAVAGRALRSLSFAGATTLPTEALKWTVATNPPGGEGNPALWSGNAPNLDASAVTEVTVPTTGPVLTFRELHLAEANYDYAYTTVSTDGGKTYTVLSNANTVEGPLGPALNGKAEAFAEQTFDLSAYAGKKVLVGFRYVSDAGTDEGGWYVDDVKVGTTLVSDGSAVTAFRSLTQVSPVPVAGWSVRLVGLDEPAHRVLVLDVSRRARNKASFSLTGRDLTQFRGYPVVVAVVASDDPTGQVQQFAPYTLKANRVTQPGG